MQRTHRDLWLKAVSLFIVCLLFGQLSSAQLPLAGTPYRPTLAVHGEALAVNLAQSLETQKLPVAAQSKRIQVRLLDLMHGRAITYPGSGTDVFALETWVLKKQVGSVDLELFYQKCFELAGGNIQRSLVLAWNFLSRDWEDALERNFRPESLRLMDITGERSVYDGSYHYRPALDVTGEPRYDKSGDLQLQKMTTKRGDNRGAWYHFAGTALAAYTYSLGGFDFGKPRLTHAMIWIEKFLFPRSSGAANQKRISIDKAGADFGFHLKLAFQNQSGFLRLRDEYKGPRQQIYTERPDLFQDDYVLKPGQRPQHWGTGLTDDHPVYQSTEYLKALLERHFEQDSLVLNPIRLMSSSEGDRFISLLKQYGEGAADTGIDELLAELVIYGNEFDHAENDLTVAYEKLRPERQELIREKWKTVLELSLRILGRHRSLDFREAREVYREMLRSDEVLGVGRGAGLVRACRAVHAI